MQRSLIRDMLPLLVACVAVVFIMQQTPIGDLLAGLAIGATSTLVVYGSVSSGEFNGGVFFLRRNEHPDAFWLCVIAVALFGIIMSLGFLLPAVGNLLGS